MSTGLPVRRATPADAEGIAAVHVASWQVAYRGFFPVEALAGLSVVKRRLEWEKTLQAGKDDIWVTGEQRITGFLDVCASRDADLPARQFVEIAAIYVHPDAWGAGCGHALCAAAFGHLRKTPAQTVFAWVLTANTPARHFYERLGFKSDDRRKDITIFGVTLPEMRYRMSLR